MHLEPRLLVVAMAATLVSSQTPLAAQRMALRLPSVSSQFRRLAEAHGRRLVKPGMERWTASFAARGAEGDPAVINGAIVLEWPGKLRIVYNAEAATFVPGSSKTPQLHGTVRELADALLEDGIDGFLSAAARGGSVRAQGNGFRNEAAEDGVGWDVYAVLRPEHGGRQASAKQYWFEHSSQLLVRVTDEARGVETRFSGWQVVGENKFPTKIERLQGNAFLLRAVLTPPVTGPAVGDGMFSE